MASTASASTSFFSSGGATIPDSGTANPYPSTTNVHDMTGLTTDIDVGILGLTHTDVSDIGAVLVSPGGQAFELFDDINGGSVSGISVTFNDQAAGLAPDTGTLSSGTYKPTARITGSSFPSPGPLTAYDNPGPAGGGTATLDGTFGGFGANGTWKLYLDDFAAVDSGSITQWDMLITTATPDATLTPAGTPIPNQFGVRDPAQGPTASRTFTATNTGATPLHLGTAVIGGNDPGDFAIPAGDDHCSSHTLAPAGVCTVDVAFDPGGVGDKTAQLRIDVADVGPLNSELEGTGQSPIASLDATSFPFGARDVASGPSAPHAFLLSNDASDVDLHVTGAALTGLNPSEFAITSNLCTSVTLTPSSSCEVDVDFDPGSAGAKAATLRFATDAPTPTTDAQLSGEGTAGGGGGGGGGGQTSAQTGQRAAALAKCKKKKGKARKKCKAKAQKLPL
jgi:hypothetical protein